MKRLGLFLLSSAAMCLWIDSTVQAGVVGKASTPAPAAVPQLGEPQTAICQYSSPPGKSGYFGKSVPMLALTVLPAGSRLTFVCSDDDNAGQLPSWLSSLLKSSKPGDVFEVTYAIEKKTKQAVMRDMKVYEMKPGENEPNVFLFDAVNAANPKTGIVTIAVTKFHNKGEFQVPSAKGSDGKMGPSEDILKLAKTFKSGASVEFQLVPGKMMIKSMKKYEPPKWARFVKLTKQTVDDKSLNAVEVDAYGNSLTLVIARKDSALTAKFSSLKADSLIIYKSTADDKGTIWLNNVTVAPKGATLPPEPKEETPDDATKPADTKKPDDKKPAGK